MARIIGGSSTRSARSSALFFVAFVLWAPPSASAGDFCDAAYNHPEVLAALADIQASIDPCGQSPEVTRLLETFRGCAQTGYEICINRDADRNSTDRDQDAGSGRVYITWNPDLHSELESGCGGDPNRVVARDPRASLLHEIAHVVQDCAGLDPNAYELEAVRIENIYRRARSLCQRTGYGTQPLPAAMIVGCEPGRCQCTTEPAQQMAEVEVESAVSAAAVAAGDAGAPVP